MLEAIKDKINFELIQIEDSTIEIIIRGEEKNKNIGVKININAENLNIEDLKNSIMNMNYRQVIDFLNKNNIKYNNIKFL